MFSHSTHCGIEGMRRKEEREKKENDIGGKEETIVTTMWGCRSGS